jgi:hypothetical protein
MNILRLSASPLLVAAVVGAACRNAGENRVLAVEGTGTVTGQVYLDRNGNKNPDPGVDTVIAGVGVRLTPLGGRDPLLTAASDAGGQLRLSDVPVGTYVVSVDTTTIPGDSIHVTRIDTSRVTITPGGSFSLNIAVGYPQVTVRQARALAPGKRVFIVGFALTSRSNFGDTTLHVADTSLAIRTTAVRPGFILAGDSVRALGTRSLRDGQPTLNDVAVFVLPSTGPPPVRQLTTRLAANADTGRADAALVHIVAATIQDTATVASPGGSARRMHVSDGSGAMEVQLDSIAGFTGAALAGDTVGAKIWATGVLVPNGTGGWRLLPRLLTDRTYIP